MVWRCWRANDFFLEIDLSAGYITETVAGKVVISESGPRNDCQHAMWPPEADEFDTPALARTKKYQQAKMPWLFFSQNQCYSSSKTFAKCVRIVGEICWLFPQKHSKL